MSDKPNYELVLGLEVHMHVKTLKKMFCYCDANIYNQEPNTHVCPVCLGLPGAMPIANFEAIQKTQLLGLALGSALCEKSNFDRKHYFYPDLPKGYQISQYKNPLCEGGQLLLDSGKTVDLERIHLEEDTAKSFHSGGSTLIDFNKSGMPLIEIVTKPCFSSVEDAVDFCKKIQDIVRLLQISDADMEKGQLRLEANISVRDLATTAEGILPDYKVEVKNINSFKFMERAVKYEYARQIEVYETGEIPVQENRGWDEKKQKTITQREKEEAHDYRYFPEPDLPPMVFTKAYLDDLKAKLPELPHEKKLRYISTHKLNIASATWLTSGDGLTSSTLFEEVVSQGTEAQRVANLIINKKAFQTMSSDEFIKALEQENSFAEVGTQKLKETIQQVLQENPATVADYKKGKEASLQFLLGQVAKKLGKLQNPPQVLELIKELVR